MLSMLCSRFDPSSLADAILTMLCIVCIQPQVLEQNSLLYLVCICLFCPPATLVHASIVCHHLRLASFHLIPFSNLSPHPTPPLINPSPKSLSKTPAQPRPPSQSFPLSTSLLNPPPPSPLLKSHVHPVCVARGTDAFGCCVLCSTPCCISGSHLLLVLLPSLWTAPLWQMRRSEPTQHTSLIVPSLMPSKHRLSASQLCGFDHESIHLVVQRDVITQHFESIAKCAVQKAYHVAHI